MSQAARLQDGQSVPSNITNQVVTIDTAALCGAFSLIALVVFGTLSFHPF